ncbi:MAG: hypothetical protein K2J95_13055 [Lachnospiraceae bacterium]|nr:hypothetical protein [Lachnospiraceae bacterium]
MKKVVFSRLFMGVCICLFCCGFVMGCGKDGEGVGGVQDAMNQEVMNVSGNSVYMSDYYLYLMQYFYNYNITPLQLTEESINTIMETATNDLKAEMVRKSLVEEAGLEANEAQLEMIETMVTAYRGTFTDELLNDYGIDETAIRNMIARQLDTYLITEKAAGELQAEFMVRYEEQYAEYQFRHMYYVLFPNVRVNFDENGEMILDETGNPIPLTEEEEAEQLLLAEEFRERAVEGMVSGDTSASMELLAVEYGIGAFSGEQYYVNGLYDEELSRMVESLSDGEISEVTMTDAGYIIVRMDNSNDTEYKEQMITQLAAQATEECKDILVQSWVAAAGVQDIQPDQELLNTIDVMALCEEMIARGIWFDQNNLYGQ